MEDFLKPTALGSREDSSRETPWQSGGRMRDGAVFSRTFRCFCGAAMESQVQVENRVCQVCGVGEAGGLKPGVMVSPGIAELIRRDIGKWDEGGCVCLRDLQAYR